MTETGFREMGWEVATLEEQYEAHVTGWNYYLPRLAPYVATLATRTVKTATGRDRRRRAVVRHR